MVTATVQGEVDQCKGTTATDFATVTVTEPPPPEECSDNLKIQAITFTYTGASCSDPLDNPQEGRATCTGDPAAAEPVSIAYIGKDPDKFGVTPGGESIQVNGTVTVEAIGRSTMHADTRLEIRQGGVVLQTVNLHTSCSKSLGVGDIFGALRIEQIVFVPK